MSDSNNTGAFLSGFLLGGLVGMAAALLMTPQSGETTRVQLKDRGIELKTQFSDLGTGIQERGRVIIDEKLPRGGVQRSSEVTDFSSDEGDDTAIDEAEN
jgi:gas vesicle protein